MPDNIKVQSANVTCSLSYSDQYRKNLAPRVRRHNTAETDSANYTTCMNCTGLDMYQSNVEVNDYTEAKVHVSKKWHSHRLKHKTTTSSYNLATNYHYLTSYIRFNWICRCLDCFSLNYKALPVSSDRTWMTSLVPNLVDQMGLNLWMSQPLYQHRCHYCTETAKHKEYRT